MTSSSHPNDVAIYSPTPEQLDTMLARSVERAADERSARLRAAAWPRNVEDLLNTLAIKVVALEARVVELEAGKG